MKKHSGLYSAVSILLVIVLVAGISLSLLSSGRTRPENPISTQPDRLQAESLQGSGSTGGQSSGKDNTENTDTAQDPSEPQKPDEPQNPDDTQKPDDTKPDPSGPTDPTDNPGKGDQGGSKSDDNKGGSCLLYTSPSPRD